MISRNAFSIRNSLQGELRDFIRGSGFDCPYQDDLARDVMCLLGSYREEGTPLFPQLFILPNVTAIAALAPGTRPLALGKISLKDGAASAILKNTASLAVGGWAIYVAKTSDVVTPPTVEYGLFRALKHSFASSAEESMGADPGTSPVMLIRNRGHLIVEVVNAKSEVFTASFTSAVADKSSFAAHVAQFSEAVCWAMDAEIKKSFLPYLKRLLLDTLQHCRGTLLAAHATPPGDTCPEPLSDGVWLTQPIDLVGAHAKAINERDSEALASLQAIEAILAGMINSDGVVLFSTKGSILGYRTFLRPNEEEKKAASHKGGGRRRTFDLMVTRLGVDLRATLIRSHDGESDCKTASA